MSEQLLAARRYESEAELSIAPESRPGFHLCARVGWMNDPNGFSWHGGLYHLFYQYHPYDTHWGPMHWGHAVSKDLLSWRYLPAALAPDAPCDRGGCFSGSAVTLPDGRHALMYTGVSEDRPRALQTQNLAFGDGTDYVKYARNPVISTEHLPEGASPHDFRDPKLWREADGSYRALVANDQAGRGGQVLLFRSDDLLHWEYVRPLAENRGRLGTMWECPDFFALDGAHVLLASAQDMLPRGFEYRNGNGAFYLLGRYDPDTGRFDEESDHAVDYGIDFYAPQTLLTPDGRRVMIGWMQNWDTCNLRTHSAPWFGQMSLPRELSVQNGALLQRPVRELEALRGEAAVYRHVEIADGTLTLPGVLGRMADLEIELEPGDAPFTRFEVRFAQDARFHTSLSFRPAESALKLDRRFSGSRRAIIHQSRAEVNHDGGRLKLRLILDRCSAEVFVNDGEKAMSATLYTDPAADGITFLAEGRLKFSVAFYPLNPR